MHTNHKYKIPRWLLALALIAIILPACTPTNQPTDAPIIPILTPTSTLDFSGDWYAVYFSDPKGPNADTLRGGPDAALAAAIDQARASVDVAIYDLNLWSLRDALLDAHRRGVQVRMVVESDNLDREEVQELIAAGLPIFGDQREALMHDKFVVIDRYEIWTGSMNFTLNGAYRNNNNLIRIRSSRLAENYLAEFEEMFTDGDFGAGSPANTPYTSLTIEGVQVETYFSPDDGTATRILELLFGAQESIYFLAFSFTSDDIAVAMYDAVNRGVDVAGVFETSQASGQGGEFFNMADAGLKVELDGNPRNMHHKVMIIDQQIVILGSYNFTASAEERNDENTLIIHSPEIAVLFLEEFARIMVDVQ